ncbi:acyl-CoA carboxylase subunit beta [Agilicoccus flavus]|uniref:acyl-CoA carboxylase subunit beta n=1 Tax=Agilicoccus flavus TaxID=2775968 RepID=UPI001CF60F28|nr:acyl-CoA carboxylase subunit beta [Agilicoccus flavus]
MSETTDTTETTETTDATDTSLGAGAETTPTTTRTTTTGTAAARTVLPTPPDGPTDGSFAAPTPPERGGDPRVADVRARLAAAHEASGTLSEKARAKLDSQNKLYVRDRIDRLFDPGSFVEDGRYANAMAPGLPADGVVTGRGTVDGRPAIVIANDPSVKAGSWGARTVEKIIRATEAALREELPVFWFVDSAGARITDQVEMFPGRRGAGRIFHNQVALSGRVPQICCLFGPSAAGGAYIPSFTDVVIMVDGNASMYLGSPRMAEMVVGERVSLEEMGGARMHCTVSGVGDLLVADDEEAIDLARLYFSYLPENWRLDPPVYEAEEPSAPLTRTTVPEVESRPFDVHEVIDGLVDDESFFEIKPLFAAELVVGFGRLEGRTIGIVANNSMVKGGVLFTDSADKATRFIWLCDAFSIPLVYLADVPGFMIGSEVERGGIIRHGAKMVAAVSEATVPQLCVVVRKAYGAGLYAMGGPGFGPEATIALPTARIAVMGPEAAVNAVYANRIAGIEDPDEREAFVAARRAEYETDVDLERLAADLVIDSVVEADELRDDIARRLRFATRREREFSRRRHGVYPV